jgi:hypothetical protein
VVHVPDQKFYDPTSGDELVTVHWDFGLTSVDVAFGGTVLTRITDINQLRTTGMGGATPDGGSLIIKLGFADAFEVTRNGERLTPSDVNAFTHTPVSGTHLDGSPVADTKLSLDAAGRLVLGGKRVDEHAMGMIRTAGGSSSSAASAVASARGWLLFFSIVNTCSALFMAWATFSLFTADAVEAGEESELFEGILLFAKGLVLFVFLVLAAIATGSWVLWKVADGPSARKAMTVSKWIAVGYLGLTALKMVQGLTVSPISAIISGIIPLLIEFGAFQAFSKAQSLLPEE